MNLLMKDLILGVSIMAMGTAVVAARQIPALPAAVAASTNEIGPRIKFATMLHDFGRARAGEPVLYTYVFTNTGNRVLILNSVQPQCGCTTAGQWSKQVEPGQTGVVPIKFNTSNYNGPVFKQVTVTCNVTKQPMLFLQLRGTVYRPYEVIPPLAVLNIPPDSGTATAVVTITNHTEAPLMVSAPQCNNHEFTAELKTNFLGKEYQLTISAVPPTRAGSVQGQITLQTGWTNPPVITVPVVANVQPAVMVIPSYITLAPGPLASAVTNSVTIQNRSTNSLVLSDPVVDAPGVEVQIKELQPGKYFTILVGFPQGFQLTPGRQVQLIVKSSNPKFPIVRVPILQMPHPMARRVPFPRPARPITAPVATGPTPPPMPASP